MTDETGRDLIPLTAAEATGTLARNNSALNSMKYIPDCFPASLAIQG
jgi:hypothetical protein